ncbi:hypothetical protein B0H13DRAFT_1908176 [Mycena leptocephala]|nr:hypothetical protein B0H13DRAFT_1908176 [Mycena leptocephala]
MAGVIDLEPDVLFDPSQWIRAGKIYKDVPIEVSDAFVKSQTMPSDLKATFPSPTIPVTEFLALKLPEILDRQKKKFSTETTNWFSDDSPNCDAVTALWALNFIPPVYLLRELENDCPQQWLNGAQSVLDPHDKFLRFPLFSLAFYSKIHALLDAQEKWQDSVDWARDLHPGAPDGQLDWTRLVNDEWLSGEIIDSMMADIQSRVAEIPGLDSSVTVAPLSFQRAIIAISTQKKPTNYTVGLLEKYKQLAQGGKPLLYFPLHINGNHWIAFIIDFVRRFFGYGIVSNAIRAQIIILSQETPMDAKARLSNSSHISQNGWTVHLRVDSKTAATFCHILVRSTTSIAVFTPPILSSMRYSTRASYLMPTVDNYGKREHIDALDLGPEDFFEAVPLPVQAPIIPTPSSQSISKILNLPSLPDAPVVRTAESPVLRGNPAVQSPEPVPPPHVPGKSVANVKINSAKQTGNLASKRKTRPETTDSDDSEDSMDERQRQGKKRAKESGGRKAKTTPEERRLLLEQDPNTVKLPSGGLKGDAHEVYCACKPNRARKLEKTKKFSLKNWESHRRISSAISAFFKPMARLNSAVTKQNPAPPPVQTKKVIVADQRLDSNYFTGAGPWSTRMPPPVLVQEEVECLGLHGDGYREYAWQKGASYLGGVSATDWTRLARTLFAYKHWNGESSDSDADSSDEDIPNLEAMPEKSIRALTTAVELAMQGIQKETNTFASRTAWTDYEKKRLYQSLVVAARWSNQPNTGAVYAKCCRSMTTNLTGTCSACTALASLPGLQQAVRRARIKAQLSVAEFTALWRRKQKFTPRMLNDNSAADVKTALANPAVLKILASNATQGPGGAFLALFQEAQTGNLDDQASFVAICNQFADRLDREKDPTGRKMKGIRYSAEMGQVAALMRSHGPRSGSQYDLLKGMIGGVSQRQLRRRVAKSAMKMVSSELCAENLEAAVEFGKLMQYDGPWICAGARVLNICPTP